MDFVFWTFWFERPLHFRAFKPSYTGWPKKLIHSVLQLKSVVGVQSYFFRGASESEFRARSNLPLYRCPFRIWNGWKPRARADTIHAQKCPNCHCQMTLWKDSERKGVRGQHIIIGIAVTEIPKHWFNSQRVLLVLQDLFRNRKLMLLKFVARCSLFSCLCSKRRKNCVRARAIWAI